MVVEQKKRGPKRSSANGNHTGTLEDNLTTNFGNSRLQYNPNDFISSFDQVSDPLLQFEADFVSNFALNPSTDWNTMVKPSKFNPLGQNPIISQQQQQIVIDPVVLNYYTQLNPKLNAQQDLELFLTATLQNAQNDDASDLKIAELPGIPSSFYLHLISMFFTYYHKSFPLLQESVFFENLIPKNRHHPMLLNTIYAIGCQYSRSPHLYQTPFFSPQSAYEYFINNALRSSPPPEVWALKSSDTISICQASLLISSCDYQNQKSYSWMMFGMGIRQAQRFEMHSMKASHDFISVANNIPKFHVDCTEEERQRIWWAALMNDLFLAITSGPSLLIHELDYVDTLVTFKSKEPKYKFSLIDSHINEIENQQSNRILNQEDASKANKWMPFFSGFPSDSIFGASDMSCDQFMENSFGFFQVGHLFSNIDDYSSLIQLSFITRRTLRYTRASISSRDNDSKTTSYLYNLASQVQPDIEKLHDCLILWYENLPRHHKLWLTLEPLISEKQDDINSFSILKDGGRFSSISILINFLFFSTLSLLHQTNAGNTALKFDSNGALLPDSTLQNQNDEQTFTVSSSLLSRDRVTSGEVLKMAYRGQVHFLRKIYGSNMPPTISQSPPSEIVGSSIIATLLLPCCTALLSQKAYASKLLENHRVGGVPDPTGVDSLEAVVLPVLDNIGQTWIQAKKHAKDLRGQIDKLREKLYGFSTGPVITEFTSLPHSFPRSFMNLPGLINENNIDNFPNLPNTSTHGTPVTDMPPKIDNNTANSAVEKSWQDLRNEFEDEFLL